MTTIDDTYSQAMLAQQQMADAEQTFLQARVAYFTACLAEVAQEFLWIGAIRFVDHLALREPWDSPWNIEFALKHGAADPGQSLKLEAGECVQVIIEGGWMDADVLAHLGKDVSVLQDVLIWEVSAEQLTSAA